MRHCILLIVCLLANACWSTAGELEGEFRPLTEDVTFKAVYRLRCFAGSQPDFTSEIQEFYQHNLQLASIYRTNYWKFNEKVEQITRHFYYSAELDRNIEVVEQTRSLGESENVELYADGSDPAVGYSQSKVISVVPLGVNTSINTYLFHSRSNSIMESLDDFLQDNRCREKTSSKLKYIRGASVILHLLECNRASIKYVLSSKGQTLDNSQGGRARLFRAQDLSSISSQRRLDVNVELADEAFEGQESRVGDSLPSRISPLSVTLTFQPERVTFRLDLFQLEMIESNKLLSSTLTGHLMLPPGIGLPDLVASWPNRQSDDEKGKLHRVDQFSFRGSLSGGLLEKLPDPIEIEVAYDGQSRLLARQMSRVTGAGKRRVTRLVYDGRAKLKYSLIADNDDYNYQIDYEHRHQWRACSSNFISNIERHEIESGDIELFLFRGAVFLGMTLVRGIPCYVYERRLLRLPVWLAAGEARAEGKQIFATIYESANELDMGSYLQERRQRDRADQASKLVRVEINQVPSKEEKQAGEETSNLFTLDLHAFQWALEAAETEPLFDVGQECLILQPKTHHLDVELEFELDQIHEAEQLRASGSWLLVESMYQTLSKAFDISRLQLIDLEAEFSSKDNSRIRAKLSIFERPNHMLVTSLVNQAHDLSVGNVALASWSIGTTSISLEECEWRAAHTMAKQELGSTVYFMHCPARMHCILGDDRWSGLASETEITISGVMKYPADKKADPQNKCDVFQMTEMLAEPADPVNDMRIYWLLGQQTHLLDKQMELRYDEEASIMLKVKDVRMSNPLEGQKKLKFLRGAGYALQSEQVEPMVVSDLAHCVDACNNLHACASYSVCHVADHRLECLLTKVNWTEPAKIEQLKSLVKPSIELSRGSSRSSLKLRLQSEEIETEIQLQKSLLCSIQIKNHLDMFVIQKPKLGDTNIWQPSDPKALNLWTSSAEECAQLCTERGQVLNAALKRRDSSPSTFRDFSCVSFYFQRSSSLCTLLPSLRSSIFTTNNTGWSSVAARWQRALSSPVNLKDKSPKDLYILDYERLFEGRSGQRMVVAAEGQAARWQRIISVKMSASDCGRLCVDMSECRSFDLLVASSGQLGTCILNQLAQLDIQLTEEPAPLKLSNDSCGSGSICWHYEPSELAIFIMSDGGQLSSDARPLATPADYATRGIFIDYRPSLRSAASDQPLPSCPVAITSAPERVQVSRLLIGLLVALTIALFLFGYQRRPLCKRDESTHLTTQADLANGTTVGDVIDEPSKVSSAWLSATGNRLLAAAHWHGKGGPNSSTISSSSRSARFELEALGSPLD